MKLSGVTDISISEFQNSIENKKIIILYPQVPYRNVFLAYFLQDTSSSVLYYRLKADETTVRDMIKGLCEEYGDVFTKTSSMLDQKDSAKLAQSLASDLEKSDDYSILYLDELDRLQSDSYQIFFETLTENLSGQNKVVVNARQLKLENWQHLVLDGLAVAIGTERRETQLMFSADSSDKPQLEINAFGRGHAIMNGLSVDSWDGALPRNLFFFFIDRDLVTRDEIFEVFWPDLNVKEATNVFHVTKRKIAERLSLNVKDNQNYELTIYSTGFYRPADKIVRHYDVAEFETAVDSATMTFDEDEQAQLYRKAINIYRAPFLLSVDMPWVHERREKLQRQLLEALTGLARIHKAAENYDESLGYFMRAIHENPLREDIHREVMALYQLLGHPQEALNQYQSLETLLQDTLGVAPAHETQDLLKQLQN